MSHKQFFGLIVPIAIGGFLPFQDIHAHTGIHEFEQGIVSQQVPWTSKGFVNEPDNFQFAIVSDRTGDHRPGVFADAIAKLNLLQPEFVMSVGDLIEGFSEDPQVLVDQWDEIDAIINDLEMRFFYVPGNHDISNPKMMNFWNDRLGASYYHFIYDDVLFLCLNSENGKPNHLGSDQLAYIEETLKDNRDVRWTLIFLHKPLWIYLDDGVVDTGWDKVESLVANRPYTVIAGHFHSYTKSIRQDRRHLVLATTGGGSSLRGSNWGELDHICWVTMTKDGPRICNIALSGIFDDAIVTQEGRDIIQSLSSKAGVNWSPLFKEQGSIDDLEALLRLKNDTSYTLRLAVEFAGEAAESVKPNSFITTLQPMSSSTQLVAIKNSGQIDPSTIPFTTSLSFSEGNSSILEIDYGQNLVVMNKHKIPKTASPIKVDGLSDDWPDADASSTDNVISEADRPSWEGSHDASISLRAQLNEQYVYFLCQIRDESIYTDTNMAPWYQDSICLRIDGRMAEERMNSRDGSDKAGISFIEMMMVPGDDFEDMHPKFISATPDGSLASCRPSAEGYVMEAAIPLSYFSSLQNGNPDGLRVNAYINDVDNPHPRIKVWWKPDWYRVDSWSGSGSFFIESP